MPTSSLSVQMVADIEIAQSVAMRPIVDVASGLGLGRGDLILKSDYIAKIRLEAIDRARRARQRKLVLVTGTTPTRYGEGKTLTTVGLGEALNRLGTKRGVPGGHAYITRAGGDVRGPLRLAEGTHARRARLERITVAFDRREHPTKVGDLTVHGAAAILLKDALLPNLVQTLEGTPAFVHGGPFANIAHGHNSVLADRLALGPRDLVLTEPGFPADLS